MVSQKKNPLKIAISKNKVLTFNMQFSFAYFQACLYVKKMCTITSFVRYEILIIHSEIQITTTIIKNLIC